MTITYDIHVKILSEANKREHWGAKARRTKQQRKTAHQMTLLNLGRSAVRPPCRITLDRHVNGSYRIRDDDNLARAHKAVRDGIADGLGIDDGDERLTWLYRQTTIKDRTQQWVRVTIEEHDD